MEKGFKSLLIVLLVGAMIFTLIGCGGGSEPSDSSGDGQTAEPSTGGDNSTVDETPVDDGPYEVYLDPNKFQGQKLVVWQFWGDDDVQTQGAAPKSSPTGRKVFEDATGATADVVVLEGEDTAEQIITAISAGTGPDIVAFYPDAKPTWMIQNLLLPLSDYADFEDPKWLENAEFGMPVWEYYTYNGKRYGINGVQLTSRIYYNKEMFELNGLDDPYELYKSGEWTWDKFVEVATALTQDTDGDGEIDQWGYVSWLNDQWFFSNGVEYVKYVDGKPVFGMDDEKAYQAMQAVHDAINKDKYMPEVWWDPNPQQRLWDGEVAMDYWGYWEMQNMRDNMGDKLGIVPFPKGPGLEGKQSADIAEAIGRGIASSSKNPELAATFLKWLFVPNPDEGEVEGAEPAWAAYGSEELYNEAVEWANNGVINPASGYSKFMEIVNSIKFIGDRTPAQAVQEVAQAAQAELDAVFEGVTAE